jgi:hypothetical protein
LETAGRQALGNGDAEDRGGYEDQDRSSDDSSRRRDGQSSDPLQHVSVLPPVPVTLAAPIRGNFRR